MRTPHLLFVILCALLVAAAAFAAAARRALPEEGFWPTSDGTFVQLSAGSSNNGGSSNERLYVKSQLMRDLDLVQEKGK